MAAVPWEISVPGRGAGVELRVRAPMLCAQKEAAGCAEPPDLALDTPT